VVSIYHILKPVKILFKRFTRGNGAQTKIFGPYVRYPKPVLYYGRRGEWDEGCAVAPRISKEGNTYYDFYMGYTRNFKSWGIGIATSRNLINWTKYKGNPVFRPSKSGWDCRAVDAAFVAKFGGKYYMFYEGRGKLSIFDYSQKIGLAYSKDLKTWTKFEGNPILDFGDSFDSRGLFAPHVYSIRGKYWLFYSGMGDDCKIRPGIAFSDDLINWKRYAKNPILDVGEGWDSHSVMLHGIINIENMYYSFYEGFDKYGLLRIGLAYSKDLKTWSKYENNPIIDVGGMGSWDESKACSPTPVLVGNSIYLLYGAHPLGDVGGTTCLCWLANCPFKGIL